MSTMHVGARCIFGGVSTLILAQSCPLEYNDTMDMSKVMNKHAYGRYFRKACSLPAQQIVHFKDALRLKSQMRVGGFGSLLKNTRCRLRPYYEEYVTRISRYDYAISLELAGFLLALCYTWRPSRLLDLGSGFSSFVFRLYKKENNPEAIVWSVDDSSVWLGKTRDFLAQQGLSVGNLSMWPSFLGQKPAAFDMILHDLDGIPTREQVFPVVLGLAAQGGAVVVDDMHMYDHRVHMRQVLATAKLKYYSASFFTKDKNGRYAYLVKS
jgi:hypothetical protein